MSDLTHPLHPAGRHDGVLAHEGGATLHRAAPLRPEAGSPLERLLRRQSTTTRAGGLLGFVPAQVR